MSGKAIHDDMLATLGHNTPAYSVVKSLLAKFKRGRNRVEDEHRSGRPKDAASTENIHIVQIKSNQIYLPTQNMKEKNRQKTRSKAKCEKQ